MRLDLSRFQVDITRPYSVRSAQTSRFSPSSHGIGYFGRTAHDVNSEKLTVRSIDEKPDAADDYWPRYGGVCCAWDGDAAWLFLIMATVVRTPSRSFAGHANLPGVRLWYTDSGNGAPLVLLHANTGNSDGWQHNIPGLVEAGYRTIAFDRRGWGRSIGDPDSGPQPGTIAEDLHALVE